MGYIIGAVAFLAAVGVYLAWTAGRIDRMHARVDAARATLDATLVRRAAASEALGGTGVLPTVLAERLVRAAVAARFCEGLDGDRENSENALSRVLRAAAAEVPDILEADGDLPAASVRVGFARRFYNDAVRDTIALRQRRLPRLFRLAGHVPLPVYFEIDDAPLLGGRPVPVDGAGSG